MTDIKTEADSLINKFYVKVLEFTEPTETNQLLLAKQCAIIHCEGMINDWEKNEDIAGKFEITHHYQNLIEYIQKM